MHLNDQSFKRFSQKDLSHTFCKYRFNSSREWKRSGRAGGAKTSNDHPNHRYSYYLRGTSLNRASINWIRTIITRSIASFPVDTMVSERIDLKDKQEWIISFFFSLPRHFILQEGLSHPLTRRELPLEMLKEEFAKSTCLSILTSYDLTFPRKKKSMTFPREKISRIWTFSFYMKDLVKVF